MTEATFFQTAYDRSQCDIGIVHIGYGAFHRAHQAVYVDDYMQASGDLRWGIAAVNLRPSEAEAFEAASAANNGYALKSIAPDGTQEFRTVRSHVGFFDATRDPSAAVDLFTDPSVRVATITVTESGYSFNEDWSLNLNAAPIAADLSGGGVQTVYGYLAAALGRRAKALDAPITVLCCDNIRSNGRLLKRALLQYLHAADQAELAAWVRRNVTFPCSMVDRITPRSTPALEANVRQLWPELSLAPIHAEAFMQWVLEDRFAADMPDLASVGVQIVADVEPYEEAKIRILNGGHTGLCYFGALGGHQTFDAAMTDPGLRGYFDAWEDDVLTGLGDHIPFDTRAYLGEVAKRFENKGIADQLARICMDGYSKMGLYIRPTLDACLAQGRTPNAGYDCVASWVIYARHHAAGIAQIPYHEPFWDTLAPMLEKGREDDIASDPLLWGDLPQRFASFGPDLKAAIQRMDKKWQD